MGQTTAIVEADASRMPARMRIVLEVESSIVKKTIEARRKKVNKAITIEVFNKVEIIPKND